MEQMSLINNIVSWDHQMAMSEERKNNLKGYPVEKIALAEESQKFEKCSSTKQIIYRRHVHSTANC
ncbi:MAG: hypothetical protein JEZ00_21980 [Anaerolineaceae bacterium]|nr:hypothetical protein [Anaerolineaceae bacterium]